MEVRYGIDWVCEAQICGRIFSPPPCKLRGNSFNAAALRVIAFMPPRMVRWIFVVFAVMFGAAGHAVEVDGLYDAEVAVTAQDVAQRQDAMRAALAEVLVKVTGNRAIGAVPGVAEMVANAPQYAQQYVYRAAPVALGAKAPQINGKVMWVRFDRDVLNRVLRQAGIGIWGRGRPTLLLWLNLRDSSDYLVLGADNKPEWKQFIESVAKARGVPLMLPTLDADDLANLQAVDLWTAPPEDVLRISARYQPEAILLGRIDVRDGVWRASWSLYDQENRQTWNTPGNSRDGVVLDGLQGAIDELSSLYTNAGVAESGTLLQVVGVKTLAGYARVSKYLESLASVTGAQLVRVEGAELYYRVEVQGGMQRLANDIRLGAVLAPLPADTAVEGAPTVRFRLLQ